LILRAYCGRNVSRSTLQALVVVFAFQGLSAQVEMSGRASDEDRGLFSLDAIAFAGTGNENRLDVFVQVSHDALTFVKQDELYNASFEVTLSLLDSAGGLVNEKSWTEEIKGVSFDQSISSNAFRTTQRMFRVQPGPYRLSATLQDLESKTRRRIEVQVPVTDFSRGTFALSDVFLLARVSQKGDVRSIQPNVTANVGELSDPFYFYLELYNRVPVDSVRLVTTVLNDKKDRALEVDTLVALRPGKNEKILHVSQGKLPLGDYRLFVRAYPMRADPSIEEGYLAVTNRQIIVRWRGMPKSLNDLDEAIEQVRYIAKDDEWSKLKEAKTPEEKQARFLEFWKKRDPNPNTPRNEKMEDYYQRVAYANKHFGHYQPGWRTDMGMVYLIFGPPNNVERHPFDIDSKPYEVWTYYDISYSFVFLDETGFGDYRLITPLWEVYDRARR
jgi:GWxTD domain-containing protein